MSGNRFVADTNILIYILEGNKTVLPYVDEAFYVSIITEIELLGMKGISAYEISKTKQLLKSCRIIGLTAEIKEIAIMLKQKQLIKTPDVLIAATALFLDLPLLTADAGFRNIKSIDLVLLS